jgi:O-antigen ligase
MAMLGLSPLIRGGNRSAALILLEWLSLVVLLALLGTSLQQPRSAGSGHQPIGKIEVLAIGALAFAPAWFAIFQLFPIPERLWESLPGHAPYVDALRVAQAPQATFRTISLIPDLTVLSLLAGLPLSAAFLLAYRAPMHQLKILALTALWAALLQAFLGLLQLGPFPGLYFEAAGGGRAIGTFANPNHFASFIAMTVPLAVLFFRQSVMSSDARDEKRRRHQPMGVVWGVVVFIMLAAVLASGSRGGTVTTLAVLLFAVLLLRRRRNRHERRWAMAGILFVLGLVAFAVGLDTIVSRFESDQTGYFAGDRWQMIVNAWRAAVVFWPFGAGLGTFSSVFPAFHPVGLGGFVEHAHNDYVQLLMEGGLLAVVLALIALHQVTRQVLVLARRDRQVGLDQQTMFQVACGIGLLAVVLHSWVDFNYRIPANAMLAAFLFGAFLRPVALPSSRGAG